MRIIAAQEGGGLFPYLESDVGLLSPLNLDCSIVSSICYFKSPFSCTIKFPSELVFVLLLLGEYGIQKHFLYCLVYCYYYCKEKERK